MYIDSSLVLSPGGSVVSILRFGGWYSDLEVAYFSFLYGLYFMGPTLFRKQYIGSGNTTDFGVGQAWVYILAQNF